MTYEEMKNLKVGTLVIGGISGVVVRFEGFSKSDEFEGTVVITETREANDFKVGTTYLLSPKFFEIYNEPKSKKELSETLLKNLGVKKVVFNGRKVVVILNSGVQGIATCGEQDFFDEEVGFAVAYTIAKTKELTKGNKAKYKSFIDFISRRKNAKPPKGAVVIDLSPKKEGAK